MLQKKSIAMHVISFAVAVMFLFVSMLASTESVNAASKLKVTASKRTIYVGQTLKLKANKNVKWSVSKKKIVKLAKIRKRTVSVKGLKAGTVYVKAKAGRKYKKIRITVKAKPKKQMKLVSSSYVIGIGEYCSLTATISNTTGGINDAYFSSSDESILNVNNRGLVIGVSPGTATITAKAKEDKSVKATVDITVVPTKAGSLTLEVDLSDESRYPKGKVAKVWLPVPQSDDYQSISRVKAEASTAKVKEFTTDSAGGKQLYIEWDADTLPADRKATLSYHIYRKAIVRSDNIEAMESGTVDKEAFAYELQQTNWSGDLTKGIVKETADSIVADAGAKTVYQKAFAIYDWMCENVIREDNKKVIFGDVVSMLDGTRNAGSCMDTNSIFVALCRAEGIPARNCFGMRFTSPTQTRPSVNCRAEFYLPGYGWVVVDPALAIKWTWDHESDFSGKTDVWKGVKDKYWGNGEENWICVNTGRDIWLDPPQSVKTGEYLEVVNPDGTINLLMFPYGEYGGQYIPCQDKQNFKYQFSFEEEDPLDCGC